MSEVDPPLRKEFRLILSLGKYRVISRTAGMMRLALGGTTEMTVSIPEMADVREGDILTLYTEVLYKDALRH